MLLSLFFVFSAFVPFSVILRVDAHSAMAQGKESSVICMSARSIVTSVLLFSLSVMISGCLFTCWLISFGADLCWLLWTQLYGSVVRAVDCRSAGHWFDSGWKSWFTFMTWSSNQIIQMINVMSPIRISIRTITRNSVKRVPPKKKHRWVPKKHKWVPKKHRRVPKKTEGCQKKHRRVPKKKNRRVPKHTRMPKKTQGGAKKTQKGAPVGTERTSPNRSQLPSSPLPCLGTSLHSRYRTSASTTRSATCCGTRSRRTNFPTSSTSSVIWGTCTPTACPFVILILFTSSWNASAATLAPPTHAPTCCRDHSAPAPCSGVFASFQR